MKQTDSQRATAWAKANPAARNAIEDRYQQKHRVAINTRARARYAANPERQLKAHRKWRGMPEAAWDKPDICERPGCGRPAKALDHDHETGEFRGWLCIPCNVSIGNLGDDIIGLECAIAYLRRTT